MDHQIQHDRHIGAARLEGRQPLALDEQRVLDQMASGANDRIEPLDVPHLQHHTGGIGRGHQLVCLGQRRGHRLLEQDRDACLQGSETDFDMRDRGHRDDGALNLLQQRLPRGKGHGLEGRRDLPRPFRPDVVDPGQFDLGHRRQMPGMMPSEGSHPDDAEPRPGPHAGIPRRAPLRKSTRRRTSGVAAASASRTSSASARGMVELNSSRYARFSELIA
jgi:hypothetical protein